MPERLPPFFQLMVLQVFRLRHWRKLCAMIGNG